MAPKPRKDGGPGTWKYTVGCKPNTVTAFERKDKGNVVWLRWSRRGSGQFSKMSLGLRLRDEQGRLNDDVEKAQLLAKRAYDRLNRDEDPRSEERVDAPHEPALTLKKGLELALTVSTGMYPVENDHVADMRRYRTHLLLVLDGGVTWEKMTAVSYEQAWRGLAHLKKNRGIGGRRSCELCIVLLAQTARWLERAGKVSRAPLPEEKYRHKLNADWHSITRETTKKSRLPRHTHVEVGKLLLNLDNPDADARIRLAFRLAGEARLGQALRCSREQLDLGPVGKYGLGRFTIPDCVKKLGVELDLTPETRAAVDLVLTRGYLRELEGAFRAKRIATYPLFPGQRLVGGIARDTNRKPIGDRAATDLWHQFEQVSGVAVVAGRGWYGVRRTGTDLAENVESDGRVLNAITGHTSDATRRLVYQDREDEEVIAKATVAIHAARQIAVDAARTEAREKPETALPSTANGPKSQWERSRDAKLARRRAKHAAVAKASQQITPDRD
jgi:integrase